jgi:hypothetical protein
MNAQILNSMAKKMREWRVEGMRGWHVHFPSQASYFRALFLQISQNAREKKKRWLPGDEEKNEIPSPKKPEEEVSEKEEEGKPNRERKTTRP